MSSLAEIGPVLPEVARRAIAAWVQGREPAALPELSGPPAPVFVTLRSPDGRLRGCIGTLDATAPDVVAETARSAALAATRDPRFAPVTPEEVPALSIEVSVLGPAEPVSGLGQLDPRVYGVIVRDVEGRRGVLLPDIEGIDDAATQVALARRKGGIAPGASVRLERFRVDKWTER